MKVTFLQNFILNSILYILLVGNLFPYYDIYCQEESIPTQDLPFSSNNAHVLVLDLINHHECPEEIRL